VNRFFRPTRAEISLDALHHNIEGFRRIIPTSMKLMAVVKADAYGHGAIQVSKEVIRCGIDYLAVAFLDEALELRDAGITAPILILGYTPPEAVPLAIERDITITVYSTDVLEVLENRTDSSKKVKIHIKMDTGMGRLGVHYTQDVTGFIDRALQLEGVEIEGLFTHYACADEEDKAYTVEQHHRFNQIVEYYLDRKIRFPLLHAGNSATAIDTPGLSYNMVRLGISMYGLYPSTEVEAKKIQLEPVMSFKTGVVMAKSLPPGSGISYGTIYHTQGEEQIATLPVGYADGYSRALSGRTDVLIRGQRVPVVGRICMDQTMINVTELEDVTIGEEVVLFGKQGAQIIPADELAQTLGTINYEMTCKVSHRVPRVYYRGGQQVEIINRLHRE
jgi:alanine racemase